MELHLFHGCDTGLGGDLLGAKHAMRSHDVARVVPIERNAFASCKQLQLSRILKTQPASGRSLNTSSRHRSNSLSLSLTHTHTPTRARSRARPRTPSHTCMHTTRAQKVNTKKYRELDVCDTLFLLDRRMSQTRTRCIGRPSAGFPGSRSVGFGALLAGPTS